MAKKPTDDFDDKHDIEHEWDDNADDATDFGATKPVGSEHDDSDFVADDMNDIVDDADPHSEDDADDSHEHDFDDEGEEEAEPQKKSGLSGLIFYAIIALVVMFGGYMAYNSVMGGNSGASAPRAADVSDAPTRSNEIVIPSAAEGPIPIPPTADKPETNVASTSGWQTNLHDEPAAPVAQQPAAPMAAAPVAAPAPGTVNVPAQVVQSVATMSNQVAEMTNKVAQLSTELNTLSANNAQVSQLQQAQATQIKALEQRPVIAPVNGKPVAAVATPDPALQRDIAALRTQLADQTKQIEQLKQALAARPVVQAAPAAAAPAPVVREAAKPAAKEPKVTVKESKASTAKAASTPKASETADKPRSPKAREAAMPATERSTWVLRAATPGMAWVSPRPGSAELRRVTVGDQLDGIGQVTDIRQDGGRWVVQGSNGSIR